MKNSEKIQHLDNMIEKTQGQIDYSATNIDNEGKDKVLVQQVIDGWKMDLAAMKYGRKALQLLTDLINDEEEGGDYGF